MSQLWIHIHFYEDIKQKFPFIEINCQKKYVHGRQMGAGWIPSQYLLLLSTWITTHIPLTAIISHFQFTYFVFCHLF